MKNYNQQFHEWKLFKMLLDPVEFPKIKAKSVSDISQTSAANS